jgi:putative nucleotidyltransferase with HDIG domain
MPPTPKHLQTSLSRTGKDYAALHAWIDDPVLKAERHDFTRMLDFGPEIKAKYGEEGLREYIEHLREDMDVKLMKIWGKDAATRDEALDYYGIRRKGRDYSLDMADIKMLQDAGMCAEDLDHSLKVAGKALEIARRVCAASKTPVDMELVGRGALFHDLGKAKTHDIEHGKLGAEMGASLGLPLAITDIMQKHIRGGLSTRKRWNWACRSATTRCARSKNASSSTPIGSSTSSGMASSRWLRRRTRKTASWRSSKATSSTARMRRRWNATAATTPKFNT